jgi:hypothetical protein
VDCDFTSVASGASVTTTVAVKTTAAGQVIVGTGVSSTNSDPVPGNDVATGTKRPSTRRRLQAPRPAVAVRLVVEAAAAASTASPHCC